jgi:hypothetical protein
MFETLSDKDLTKLPRMTRWFNPSLLCRLLLKVIVADLFGQYADRRLVHAALDPASNEKHNERADIRKLVAGVSSHGDDQGVWIDYVSDLGDGFDATYAIAYLIAQEKLTLGACALPRGSALFMGGDQVYPTASRAEYNLKLRTPYGLAAPNRPGSRHPPVFIIPGNHDWYDGLASFLALFCRKRPTALGNWRTRQRRSYFATRLTDDCWLWGVDIALTADMDQPQADYFVAIAAGMPEGASIILCSAEPGWYGAEKKTASYRILSYAARLADNAGKKLRIPLVLSGDTHHYCRYSSEEGGTQFITSGGGGAFLHGTHQLKDEIRADWLRRDGTVLSLLTSPADGHAPSGTPACYPSREESRVLLRSNWLFPVTNWEFSFELLGPLFLATGFVLSLAPRLDLALGLFVALGFGLFAYGRYQEKEQSAVLLLAMAFGHAAIQFGAAILLTWLTMSLDAGWLNLHAGPWWLWFTALALVLVPIGGAVSGLIFGANLYLTCRFADANHNDAFSAMRLNSHRHFLRLRIDPEIITVYAVGLNVVPARTAWRVSRVGEGPMIVPTSPIAPHLIEEPIIVRRRQASATSDVKAPHEIAPNADGS